MYDMFCVTCDVCDGETGDHKLCLTHETQIFRLDHWAPELKIDLPKETLGLLTYQMFIVLYTGAGRGDHYSLVSSIEMGRKR